MVGQVGFRLLFFFFFFPTLLYTKFVCSYLVGSYHSLLLLIILPILNFFILNNVTFTIK